MLGVNARWCARFIQVASSFEQPAGEPVCRLDQAGIIIRGADRDAVPSRPLDAIALVPPSRRGFAAAQLCGRIVAAPNG
jgi:hypothetical protein